MSKLISIVAESAIDGVVAARLVAEVDLTVHVVYDKGGKSQILTNLAKYNAAAAHIPFLIICDLDHDFDCPPSARNQWLPDRHDDLLFTIAVREIESWLMADREHCAKFLSVSASRLPRDPESIPNPKEHLVSIARHSNKRSIHEDMTPRPNSQRTVGPAYVAKLMEFVHSDRFPWRPEAAAHLAPSLARCRELLQALAERA